MAVFDAKGPRHMLDGSTTGITNYSGKKEYERQVRRLVTGGSADGHRYQLRNGQTLIVDIYGGFVLDA